MAFDLVLDLRVDLAVAAQPDAGLQPVHAVQVVLPLRIDAVEQDVALELAHVVGADLLLAPPPLRLHALDDLVRRAVGVLRIELGRAHLDAEVTPQPAGELLRVALVDRHVVAERLVHMGVDDVLDELAEHLLLAVVIVVQQRVAQAVHLLALQVHDLVVLEQVLADLVVAALDLLLRARDGLRDHRMRDGLAVLQAELAEDVRDPIGREDAHEVVFEAEEELAGAGVALASRAAAQLVVDAPRLVPLRADDVQPAHLLDAFTELDVRTAPRHVGRDRDGAGVARVLDDRGLPRVLLRVQHHVLDAASLEHAGEALGLLDARGADEDRPALALDLHDLLDHGAVLVLLVGVDEIVLLDARQGTVGRDAHDVELVDGPELGGLGERRAGHAGDLVVELEEVLVRDRRERLVLGTGAQAFLRFDRLVQPVRPAAAFHHAARELVDDHDFAVLDDVVLVLLVDVMRAQRLLQQVQPLGLAGLEELHAGVLFRPLEALVAEHALVLLLLHLEVLARLQAARDLVRVLVLGAQIFRRTADDQRGARLVDEDRVHLVDDGEREAALRLEVARDLHVVAQIVESELAVGAVRDVAAVGGDALVRLHPRLDDADGHAEGFVQRRHPRSVAPGEVVVDGDQVCALAGQGVEVDGERGDERLAFTGDHLGDRAVVQAPAADELDVEGAHAHGALARLADGGERFGQQIVEALPVGVASAELVGLGAQLGVAELLEFGLEGVDALDDRQDRLDDPLVAGAEQRFDDVAEHGGALPLAGACVGPGIR